MNWNTSAYRYQFARRPRAVSLESGITFSDFSRMHVSHRVMTRQRRQDTPIWSMKDVLLRELIVAYLEQRFYVAHKHGETHIERLKRVRGAAGYYADGKRESLTAWLHEYAAIRNGAFASLDDDAAMQKYVSLREMNGQQAITPDVARDYLMRRRCRDLELQIQNLDTDLVLTERGHAEIITAIVYLFYRMGWDSVEVAEQLGLKPPHVRQVLARLHKTASEHPSLAKHEAGAGQDPYGNPSGVAVREGDTPAPPFTKYFDDALWAKEKENG